MAVQSIALRDLLVNRANDRHGELENETAAIAWLFANRETHMRNLAKDVVKTGGIYETPLVAPEGRKFVVFDGNRRVTCLKLLDDPRRAPNVELQAFFAEQRRSWKGTFPQEIECQVEDDRDKIDEILFRRHTGTQAGVGQLTWDDRMKATFVTRTGKGTGLNVADEIEKRLSSADLLPKRRSIPRSILNRLLSAEPFRNRLGFSVAKGRFELTHDEEVVMAALARVADDLANRKIVLNDVWDVEGKRHYLDTLDEEGVLPTVKDTLKKRAAGTPPSTPAKPPRPIVVSRPVARVTLIPQVEYGLVWPGRLQRHHQIWDELQFKLELTQHQNAISVLLRVLLELSVENYIKQTALPVNDGDNLYKRVLKVGRDLHDKSKIDKKQMELINKFGQLDQLVSSDTLNRYVHSPNFAPSPEHLASLWDSLSDFIVQCLKA